MSTQQTEPKINKTTRRKKLTLITLFFVSIAILYAIYYVIVLSKREQTDNAYVSGNIISVTSQVSGTVTEIRADETQFVKTGDSLIKLDQADAKIALNEAAAKLGQTVRQLRQQDANAEQYDALVNQRTIALNRAIKDLKRRAPLAADNTISAEEISHIKDQIADAKSALIVAQKQRTAAQSIIDGVSIQNNPLVQQAKASFEQKWLAARRNTIVSPVSGYIAKRSAQLGANVSPGQTLLSIVPLDQLWIDANFKESELRNIRIGQPVKITADIYENKVIYHGKVVGLAVGTGSAFSLLPAQNATGNWIKVVQRVPVRIQLDAKELADHPLRVGLSTTVTIDTSKRDGGVLALTDNNKPLFSTNTFTQPMQDAEKLANEIINKNLGK